MITLNFQSFGTNGFHLRLRLYQGGETRSVNVTKLLKGELRKSHWHQRKQYFIGSAPFSQENNAVLTHFSVLTFRLSEV